MNVWVLTALVIEGMAAAGVTAVWRTGRTAPAFFLGFNTMLPVTLIFVLSFPPVGVRHGLVLAMVVLYLAHLNWLLLFHHRKTALNKLNTRLPARQKIFLPFVLTNTAGWAYCLPFYFAVRRTAPLGAADLLAVTLYLAGTAVHFGSDLQKVRFKSRPENQHKLLMEGFWSWCRHPNYFGDFLIYVSFALIGGSLWAWVAPVLNAAQYLFDAIPKNERWAAEHYGPAWEAYARRTKRFIPGVL